MNQYKNIILILTKYGHKNLYLLIGIRLIEVGRECMSWGGRHRGNDLMKGDVVSDTNINE